MILRELKNGKECGLYLVSNEHLKYGGNVLKQHILHLLNGMVKVEKLPTTLKRGLLITLYKGTRKHNDDRKNHRGITLLNSIYKVFETIMLKRIKPWAVSKGITLPNDQQGAYQPQLCSVMTSFSMQETVNYYVERHSNAYACLMDTSTAFDTVWHKGLFVKLNEIGIKGKTWRLICECYSNAETAVIFQGLISNWIPLLRSVRQGGVMSPWLYLMFINDLPQQLKESKFGASIANLSCCSPVQADDICLISPLVNGLQNMMQIVELYARKWRYQLNPSKTKIMVFGESKRRQQQLNQERKWYLNGKEVEIVSSEKHVGI